MGIVRAGIVGVIGIPGPGEERGLAGNRAALHVNRVHKTVFDVRIAPVSAPDQAAGVRQFAQKREVAFS